MKWLHQAFKLMFEMGQKKRTRPSRAEQKKRVKLFTPQFVYSNTGDSPFMENATTLARMTRCSDVLLTVNIAGSYGRHSKQLLMFCKDQSRYY